MQEVLSHIHEYGYLFYLVTFIWTALEGETFVIFAAWAAQQGMLSIELLFLAAWLGSFFGDQVYFFLGRKFGHWILSHKPSIREKLSKVFTMVERNSTLFILTYRFMYGIRNVASVALGLSKLPWRRFLMLNGIAAGLWSLSFCSFGYFLGKMKGYVSTKEADVEHGVVYELTLAVIVVIVAIIGLQFLFRRVRAYLERRSEVKNLSLEK